MYAMENTTREHKPELLHARQKVPGGTGVLHAGSAQDFHRAARDLWLLPDKAAQGAAHLAQANLDLAAAPLAAEGPLQVVPGEAWQGLRFPRSHIAKNRKALSI